MSSDQSPVINSESNNKHAENNSNSSKKKAVGFREKIVCGIKARDPNCELARGDDPEQKRIRSDELMVQMKLKNEAYAKKLAEIEEDKRNANVSSRMAGLKLNEETDQDIASPPLSPQETAPSLSHKDRRLQINMTGHERIQYQNWRQERDAIDAERLARQKKQDGKWRREWDANKKDFNDEQHASPNYSVCGRNGPVKSHKDENSASSLKRVDDRPPPPAASGGQTSLPHAKLINSSSSPKKPSASSSQSSSRRLAIGRGRATIGQAKFDAAKDQHKPVADHKPAVSPTPIITLANSCSFPSDSSPIPETKMNDCNKDMSATDNAQFEPGATPEPALSPAAGPDRSSSTSPSIRPDEEENGNIPPPMADNGDDDVLNASIDDSDQFVDAAEEIDSTTTTSGAFQSDGVPCNMDQIVQDMKDKMEEEMKIVDAMFENDDDDVQYDERIKDVVQTSIENFVQDQVELCYVEALNEF